MAHATDNASCGVEAKALRLRRPTKPESQARAIAQEVPVELIFNDVAPYGTMMLTPRDLEDFAVGFALSERIVADKSSVTDIRVQKADAVGGALTGAYRLHIHVKGDDLAALLRRAKRSTAGSTACGICGSDGGAPGNCRPTDKVGGWRVDLGAIEKALGALPARQVLNQRLRMLHAAAWADLRGNILYCREDVGRHNALDKLAGALRRDDVDPLDGFCVITSRCSFEMAQKAVIAGVQCLVAVSAPTDYAVRIALDAGLCLVGNAKNGELTVFANPQAIIADQ